MSKQQPGPTFSSFLLMLAVVAATCTMMAIAAVATNPPCPPPAFQQELCDDTIVLEAVQPAKNVVEITTTTDFGKPLDGVEVRVELSGVASFLKTDREGRAKTRYEPGEVSVTGTKSGYITTQETIKLTPPATKATIKLHKSTPPEQDKSA